MDATGNTTVIPTGNTDDLLDDVRKVGRSLKIPAWLAVEIDKEIASEEMSFNSYVQNILINRHNQIPDDIEEKIGEMQSKLAEQNELLKEKAIKNNDLMNEILGLRAVEEDLQKVKRERDEYFVEIGEWENNYIKLENLLKAETATSRKPDAEPKAEKSDKIPRDNSAALRDIILENTFFSNQDIDLLIHEAANS